jgi:vacuolar-type H+-ATPase subunit I/STV1
MVEKMKRLYLLMAASDSDEVLSGLQELGVVHIETDSVVPDEDLEQMKRSITDFKKAVTPWKAVGRDEDSFSSARQSLRSGMPVQFTDESRRLSVESPTLQGRRNDIPRIVNLGALGRLQPRINQ